jgi:hypothetical protein
MNLGVRIDLPPSGGAAAHTRVKFSMFIHEKDGLW